MRLERGRERASSDIFQLNVVWCLDRVDANCNLVKQTRGGPLLFACSSRGRAAFVWTNMKFKPLFSGGMNRPCLGFREFFAKFPVVFYRGGCFWVSADESLWRLVRRAQVGVCRSRPRPTNLTQVIPG